jgi:hypothetical protein
VTRTRGGETTIRDIRRSPQDWGVTEQDMNWRRKGTHEDDGRCTACTRLLSRSRLVYRDWGYAQTPMWLCARCTGRNVLHPERPVDAKPCEGCGVMLLMSVPMVSRWVCSSRCSRVARYREEVEARRARLADRTCAECGEPIPTTKRSDTQTCGDRCRQRRRRAREGA